jgi:hypothetical protein
MEEVNMKKTELFDKKITCIKYYFDDLIQKPAVTPVSFIHKNPMPKVSGVYVFSDYSGDDERFLYVGQSNSIYSRLIEHCAINSNKKANFAYNMTVDMTNIRPILGSPTGTKKSMFYDPKFITGFDHTLSLIMNMNYRWVEVNDKLEKTLLEIYTSTVLESKFNDFD